MIRRSGLASSVALYSIAFCSNALAAPNSGFRVLHHQSVNVRTEQAAGNTEHMTFDAYGRRFELTLEPNDRIRRGMTAGSTAEPLRGSVDGLPGSWVRLTRTASGLRGMLFDGQDMYAVEPATEAADTMVQPLDFSGGETVVYRLSDALMPVDTMSCELAVPDATPDSPPTAADALEQLSAELHGFQIAAATLTRQVSVGVVGDFEFVNQFNNRTPEDAIVTRMNTVDGIFSSQLGVKIALAPSTLFRTTSDPFTKSAAKDLLLEVRNFRNSTLAQRSLGLTHLMTGRNLDGSTVGIAYITGVCDAQFGSSLSQSNLNDTQAALIAAHEIGHNFGAPHDGDADEACSTTPTTFLMAPQLNGSDQFSACSVQQIQPYLNASCITNYIPPDASLVVTNSLLSATVGTPILASFMVRASGGDASAGVSVTISLPAEVTLQSVSVNGGTCTSGAGTASCNLASLSAGDSRQVDLNVTPTAVGTLPLNLSLSSTNDANTSNNTAVINLNTTQASTPDPAPPTGGGGTSTASSGGGGGRLDLFVLGMLGTLLLAPPLRRRRASRPGASLIGTPNT